MQLEVVVQRRHAKHALARQLERRHLHDHRERFEHEHAADEHQQQFLLDQDGHGAERAAKRQRPDVAHEDLRGVRVVPEEPEAGADQRAAEDRQLASRAEMHQQQVDCEDGVAGDVRQRRVRRRRRWQTC